MNQLDVKNADLRLANLKKLKVILVTTIMQYKIKSDFMSYKQLAFLRIDEICRD